LREVAPGVSIPVLTPVFTRMRVAGLDAATTFGKLEVHGEAAAKFAVRNGATDRLQAVAGLRYTWDDLGPATAAPPSWTMGGWRSRTTASVTA
jgi:hypothetical protein